MKRCILVVSLVLALAGGSGALVASLTAGTASADTTVTVQVGDFWFCNSSFEDGLCETDIHVGDTVVWDFSQATAPHTSTSQSSGWDSGTITPGGTYQFRFTQPGTYLYNCTIHPMQMRGSIVVAAAAATPTSPPSGQTPGAGPTPTPVLSTHGPLPTSGSGPQSGANGWWWLAALAIGGGLIAIGASTLRRPRRA